MANPTNRWRKIGTFLQGLPVFWILFGIAVFAVLFEWGRREIDTEDAYLLNTYTEFLGVAATVLIVNAWYRNRDEQRRLDELKERLFREVCSPINDTAIEAIHQMQALGWVQGERGLLKERKIVVSELQGTVGASVGANLKGANLRNANLEGTMLEFADLENAKLEQATLERAILVRANLRDADLSRANLKNADLCNADLSGALLSRADLSGADLMYANSNQTGTFINWSNGNGDTEAKSSSQMQLILPDESRAAPETDLSRFTDPNHPDFWRSDDPQSPAYRDSPLSKLLREFGVIKSEPPPTPPPAGADPT